MSAAAQGATPPAIPGLRPGEHGLLVEVRPVAEDDKPIETLRERGFPPRALGLLGAHGMRTTHDDGDRFAAEITAPAARVQISIDDRQVAMRVTDVRDATAAARFCEHLDGVFAAHASRITRLPGEPAGPFAARGHGYLFAEVIAERRTDWQTLRLVAHPIYGRALVHDGEIQLGEDDEHLYSGGLVDHGLPPHACRALILGGGDGGVLREVLSRGIERAIMVELDPGVPRFCAEVLPGVARGAFDDPRAAVHFADAFAWLAACEERFDVVFSDLPDQPLSQSTLAHQLELAARVLAPGGVFATHSEHWHFTDPSHRSEPVVEALAARFHDVTVAARVIPSYQDLSWLFVRGEVAL